jgi:CelD/BcsL family acetyltransferase involved in cellulose biosynthesis
MTELELELIHDLDDVREEWSALAERGGNVFCTWESASTWWRYYGHNRPLTVIACRRPGCEPVAFVPLYLAASRPVRLARLVGHGTAPMNGPVCSPEDRPLAAQALVECLRKGALECDVVSLEYLLGTEPWSELTGGRVWDHRPSPVLRIDGLDWEGYLAGRSANLRQQIRRQERKLVESHRVAFRLCDDPERLPDDFETLIALHDTRWHGESVTFAGVHGEFHREFAAIALDRGWLRLWLLEVDGRAVAGWYGFRYGDAYWYRQSGRDPAWERWGVGSVLMAHTIREAVNDRVAEYHFLWGDEAFKRRFATEDPGVQSLMAARGLAGRAAAPVLRLLITPGGRRRPLRDARHAVARRVAGG